MAKTITYDPTWNRITAKGGTEMDPITFNDLYNADQGGGWNVVHYYGQDTYHLDALLYLGDNYTSTYFIDKEKVVVFTDVITGNTIDLIYIYSNAHIQLGEAGDEAQKEVSKGCVIVSRFNGLNSYLFRGGSTNTYRRLYGCTVISPDDYNKKLLVTVYGDGRLWHCQFGNYAWPSILGDADIYRCTVLSGTGSLKATGIEGQMGSPSIDDYAGTDLRYAVRAMPSYQDFRVSRLKATNEYGVVLDSQNKDTILTDCDLENWIMYTRGETQPGKILRKYTVNLHVADKDGNNLEGATVVCKDKDGNEVFNVQTDAYGNIAEQEIVYQQWYQLSAGFHGEEDAICYSPHSFEISKDEMSLTLENITIDKTIGWHVELQEPVEYQPAIPGLEKIYVGDRGTVFEIDVGINISNWTNLKMKVKKGDGSEAVWDAHVKPGGGNNNYIMRYVSSKTTSDFSCDGIYYITPYGESGDWKGHGRTVSFFVYPVYE